MVVCHANTGQFYNPIARSAGCQTISSGDARLDVAAQEAAAKWRFNPAKKRGQPIASKVRVPVEFALDAPAQQAG